MDDVRRDQGTTREGDLEEGPRDVRDEVRQEGAPRGDASAVNAGVVAAPATPALRRGGSSNAGLAVAFLLPALVLLAGIVIYPIFFTVFRSLFDRAGDTFVGLGNYIDMFQTDRTRTAIKNNMIWVVFGPTIATGIGLVYAVLAERVRWETVFKVAVFMPMAISGLAVGVIFTLVYQTDPDQGLANAALTSVNDVFNPSGELSGARSSDEALLALTGDSFTTTATLATGEAAPLGLVAIPPDDVPGSAEPATLPTVGDDAVGGVVFLDFTAGGGGERGVVDPGELGLPGTEVEVVRDGQAVASATSEADGSFVVEGLEPGDYSLRLAAGNFTETFNGVNWLGPTLVTPAIIASWLWIWIGFAMIVIGAGLSAIPRDVLEAARVDGASEWQVFRRVTAPLLTPVLLVVLVTLVINVLKIFDLVLVIAPGAIQDEANVIALEQWRVSFGGAQNAGLGSALSVFLFLLVIPAMAFTSSASERRTGERQRHLARRATHQRHRRRGAAATGAGRQADQRGADQRPGQHPARPHRRGVAGAGGGPRHLVAALGVRQRQGWVGGRSSASRASSPSTATGAILDNPRIVDSFWNTVLITLPATAGVVLIAALAAYAFAWIDFPGRDWAFIGVVALLVVPVQVALIPVAELYGTLASTATSWAWCCSTSPSACPSPSSSSATSSPGSLARCWRRPASTAPASCGSSCGSSSPSACPPSPRCRSSSSSGCGTTSWWHSCSPRPPSPR